MIECVKCGHKNDDAAQACAMCTWPVTESAWKSSKFKIKRITIDTGCINVTGMNEDLNTLERWAKVGLIHLDRTNEMLIEMKRSDRIAKANSLPPQPNLFTLGISRLGGPDVLAGPDIKDKLKEILFAGKT